MKVSDVMTRTVRATDPDQTVTDVAQILLNWHLSGLPVIGKDRQVVGMITEGDLLRRPESGTAVRPSWLQMVFASGTQSARDYIKTHAVRVCDAMSAPAITIDEGASLAEAAALMGRHRIKSLPVVQAGRLVGVLSRSDIFRTWARRDRAAPVLETDREIRRKLLAEIEAEPWIPAARINVTVDDGVVALWGMVDGETEKRALELLVGRQPGVVRVDSNLVLRSAMMMGL